MADTLEIFGTEYTGVTGIIAKDDNSTDKTYIRPQGTKSISANGTGIDVTEYASVDVSVPSGQPTLQTKSVSYTPSETAQSQTVTADSGYDGLDEVNVSVGAISSTYVGSGITQRSSTDLTASGATVTVPSGYYSAQASKAVTSGSAGTPTATKGTVSNHSISVTPSVTNTTGYITGGTKTGTAVSVSASELVSGTLSVTSSGTKDVTNYASASIPSGTEGTPTATKGTVSNHSISVTPSVTNSNGFITGSTKTGTAVTVSASELVSGSETKTANGTYDVTNLASLVVNVSGASGVKTGTLSVANNVNTSTSTQITTTTAIGFTPKVFIFYRSNRSATNYHINQASFITLGTSYYVRTMTRYSSNALSTSGNANNWTTQTAGYLYFNSSTIYFRSSSSYILPAGTWYWVAIE